MPDPVELATLKQAHADERLADARKFDVVQQLLREAYDLLTNSQTRVDLRDWMRAAEPFVRH
jgi:type IV secretory pathway TrbF-like protein